MTVGRTVDLEHHDLENPDPDPDPDPDCEYTDLDLENVTRTDLENEEYDLY